MHYKVKRFINGEEVEITRDFLPQHSIANGGISDLWFNHDHSAYAPNEVRGDYDLTAMFDEALLFLGNCDHAGITDAPTAIELMGDFFNRL